MLIWAFVSAEKPYQNYSWDYVHGLYNSSYQHLFVKQYGWLYFIYFFTDIKSYG